MGEHQGAVGEVLAAHRLTKNDKILLAVVIFLVATVVIYLLFAKKFYYDTYQVTSDVFSYSRAIGNTLEGHFMFDATHRYVFASHAYLVFVLYLPLYAIAETPVWLIASTPIAHGFAAVLFGGLILHVTAHRVAAAVMVIVYLLNPFVLEYVLMPVYAFQPDVLAPPLIFGFLLASLSERRRVAWFLLVLLATLKEEFALFGFGLACWLILLSVSKPFVTRLGQLGELLIPAKLVPESLRTSMYSAAIAFGCLIISLSVLVHAKSISSFWVAPELSARSLFEALSAKGAWDGLKGAIDYAAPLAFVLPWFDPILSLVLVPLRIAVNTVIYLPDFDAVNAAKGFPWSAVSAVTLIFVASVGGLARLALMPKARGTIFIMSLLPLLATVAMLWHPGRYPAAFRNSLVYFWSAQPSEDAIAAAQLDAFISDANPHLDTAIANGGARGFVLISPKLFSAVVHREAAVVGAAQYLNQELFSEAAAAFILKEDVGSIAIIAGRPEFIACYSNDRLVIYVKQSSASC